MNQNIELLLLVRNLCLIDKNKLFHIFPDIKILIADFQFPLLHLGQFQDVVDQCQQLVTESLDLAERIFGPLPDPPDLTWQDWSDR